MKPQNLLLQVKNIFCNVKMCTEKIFQKGYPLTTTDLDTTGTCGNLQGWLNSLDSLSWKGQQYAFTRRYSYCECEFLFPIPSASVSPPSVSLLTDGILQNISSDQGTDCKELREGLCPWDSLVLSCSLSPWNRNME